jgi:hypothetical protein
VSEGHHRRRCAEEKKWSEAGRIGREEEGKRPRVGRETEDTKRKTAPLR